VSHLDELEKELVMIFVLYWISFPFINILFARELGRGYDSEDSFWNHLSASYVDMSAKFVDLCFIKISDRGEKSVYITIECCITESRLGFISIIREDSSDGS
jgi:hypothetical protein